MTIHKIHKAGSPRLKQVAQPVPLLADRKDLIKEMFATMKASDGVGLAANQIGEGLLERIIVIDTGKLRVAIINPVITKKSVNRMVSKEGCLSFPGKRVTKKRHQRITVEGYDEHWIPVEIKVKGFDACVIQHEIAHLKGETIA